MLPHNKLAMDSCRKLHLLSAEIQWELNWLLKLDTTDEYIMQNIDILLFCFWKFMQKFRLTKNLDQVFIADSSYARIISQYPLQILIFMIIFRKKTFALANSFFVVIRSGSNLF